ncbi:MAG: LPS export ABC transporter periplasmic protein LptC [Candidatus Marinimicrobia bacterium]|nr:LPS export ABC transporter periplasmic protein LptC [Candidatus Neomarinimicrobiota bacterium]
MCILLFFSILIACEPVGNSMDGEKTSTDRLPSQESWNTMIRINSVGKENVQARAAYSAHYDDPREILFIGDVQLDFFNEEGKHSSTMSADTGRIDDKRHLFTATGSVFVVSDSGMTLATSILYWNESKEAIFTDQPIVLTTESDTLFGIGFESNSNLTNWTITQPTGVTYREIDDE